jgi:DegV family protein with EDD domain
MVKIVTDAEANLTPELMERFDIKAMPLWIHFGQESYQEGVNITRQEFYERLATGTEFPKTSQASVGQFVELYRPIIEAGHEIVSIHISSRLSGTYQAALNAARQLAAAKISVVDSRHATTGQAMVVWHAAEWAEAGWSRAEIVAGLQPIIKNIRLFFVVDTLEYLRRGGRIGSTAALMAKLLQVKPILTLKDGLIVPYGKTRTRKRALVRLKELVLEAAGGHTGVDLGVVHARCPEEAQALTEELSAELKPQRVLMDLMGSGIGAHVGPGMIGAGVYCED